MKFTIECPNMELLTGLVTVPWTNHRQPTPIDRNIPALPINIASTSKEVKNNPTNKTLHRLLFLSALEKKHNSTILTHTLQQSIAYILKKQHATDLFGLSIWMYYVYINNSLPFFSFLIRPELYLNVFLFVLHTMDIIINLLSPTFLTVFF
jgi:hypothetical protein